MDLHAGECQYGRKFQTDPVNMNINRDVKRVSELVMRKNYSFQCITQSIIQIL